MQSFLLSTLISSFFVSCSLWAASASFVVDLQDRDQRNGTSIRTGQWALLRNSLESTLNAEFKQWTHTPPEVMVLRRRLDQWMNEHDYSGAALIRVVPLSESIGNISFRLIIDPGYRVTFGFRGNRKISISDLREILLQYRLIGYPKDIVRGASTKLIDYYRKQGYESTKIEVRNWIYEETREQHFTFSIIEGDPTVIESIRFSSIRGGNGDEFVDQFWANAGEFTRTNIYESTEFQLSLDRWKHWFLSQGWLGFRIQSVRKELGGRPNSVIINCSYDEGKRTYLDSVEFVGNRIFDSSQLEIASTQKIGEPFNIFSLAESIDSVKEFYRSHGYLGVKILNEDAEAQSSDSPVVYRDAATKAGLSFVIEEGSQCVFAGARYQGLNAVKIDVVRREEPVEFGSVLTDLYIRELDGRLRKTQLFSSLSIDVEEVQPLESWPALTSDQKWCQLSVRLAESSSRLLSWGLGFRNDLGVRGFAELSWQNLHGLHHQLGVKLSGNRRLQEYRFLEYLVQGSYRWPFVWTRDDVISPLFSQEKRQFRPFDADSTTASLTYDWPFTASRRFRGGVGYTFELIEETLRETGLVRSNQIGSISPQLRWDFRDNPLLPRKGFFASAQTDFSHPFLGSQGGLPISFVRFVGRFDAFAPLPWNVVGLVSLKGGYIRNLGELFYGEEQNYSALPLSKMFALGGIGSLRGYQLQELTLTEPSKGWVSFFNVRTQLTFPLYGKLGIAPFWDAGNVFESRFALDELRSGAGVGIHYETPVGSVNFDWGFKINPPEGASTNEFYFSLGLI